MPGSAGCARWFGAGLACALVIVAAGIVFQIDVFWGVAIIDQIFAALLVGIFNEIITVNSGFVDDFFGFHGIRAGVGNINHFGAGSGGAGGGADERNISQRIQ